MAKYRISPAFFAVLIIACCALPALAKKPSADIKPGPTTISAEERRIDEDPDRGIEHAVILVEETARNENAGIGDMETRFHRRVKILSNEGRDLANIEVRFDPRSDRLKEWWGRTILPDGTVLELHEDDLESQTVARAGDREFAALKAALPGVVPGSVIDYGYTIRAAGFIPYDYVPLQRAWPVREFLFHWTPSEFLQGAYFMMRTDGLDVTPSVAKDTIIVRARNLPPFIEEPMMPPVQAVRAGLVFYYVPLGTDFDRYWDDSCKDVETLLKAGTKSRSVSQAIETMALPGEGTPMDRARAAYDWLGRNIKRTGLRTFEEIHEAKNDEGKKGRDLVRLLLESREGSSFEINAAFIAILRMLGVEAYPLAVSDRTERFWVPELKTFDQFDTLLVAIRPPGAGEDEIIVSDPCSGLPFGQVPWWYSGVNGMLMTKKGPQAVLIPVTTAKDNVNEARVELEFSEGNELLSGNWVRSGRGQVGLTERRYLRRLSPEDRIDRLEHICGAAPETDILSAELVGLEELDRQLELHCEFESYDTEIDDDVGYYNLPWHGPWIQALPDLPPGGRTYPVLFDFPRAEVAIINVRAPEGFVAQDAPQPVDIKSQLGVYRLRVAGTADGYQVQRQLIMVPLMVPLDYYAEFRDFVEQVRSHDRGRLKFTRAELAR